MLTFKAFPGRVGFIAFSPDGARLVVCGGGQGVKLFEAFTGHERWHRDNTNRDHWHGLFTPDGQTIVVRDGTGLVVLTASDGREKAKHSRSIAAFALPDHEHILAVTQGMDIADLKLLTLRGKQVWKKRLMYHGGITRMTLSPDGRHVGSVGAWEALLIDLMTRKVRYAQSEGRFRDGRADAVFSPDSRTFVYSVGPSLHVVNVETATRVKSIARRGSTICELAFTRDGRRLLSVSNDVSVKVWDTATWTSVQSFKWKVGRLTSVTVSPDGTRAAVASESGHVVVWDVEE